MSTAQGQAPCLSWLRAAQAVSRRHMVRGGVLASESTFVRVRAFSLFPFLFAAALLRPAASMGAGVGSTLALVPAVKPLEGEAPWCA